MTRKWPMWLQIITGMVLAVIVGLIFNATGTGSSSWEYGVVNFAASAFVRLIKMLVIPLVVTSLLAGVTGLKDPLSLGSIGWKTIVYYVCTTFISALIGLILVNVIQPGVGFTMPSNVQAPSANQMKGIGYTFLHMIPTNPIDALTQGQILQVILFSILVAIAVIFVGKKAEPLADLIEASFEVMMTITRWIMTLAPYGVFALIVRTVADNGSTVFAPLAKYMLVVILGLAIHVLITYTPLVSVLGKTSPRKFFSGIAPAWLVAFSTASSSGTLPVTLRSVEENLGVSNRVSSFVLPLGATVNMDGTALYEGVAALFIAQAYGIHLGIGQQIIVLLTASLAAIGAAGIPGAGLITMVMVLNAVGLPTEGIGLVLAVDRILDMCRTSVNVLGDATGSLVISRLEDETVDVDSISQAG